MAGKGCALHHWVHDDLSSISTISINPSTRTHQAATKNRGKAIVNSPQPIYDQEPSMVDDDDETSKIYKPTNNNLRTSSNTSRAHQDNSLRIHRNTGYESQRSGNVAGARETVGSSMVQKSGIQCYNCKEYGHVARECQKPKRAKDATYHREKMLLCKQEEAGIQLNADQADWKDDTDDESDDQELEAHYMYMAKIQEVSPDAVDSGPIFDTEPEHKVQNDDHYDVFAIECQHTEQSDSVHNTYPIEQDAQNVSIESVDMNYDSEQIDQNDEDVDLTKERELLASLIEKLKCEIDESKNRNTLLETSNKVLVEKLKSEIADFKNKSLTEGNNKLSEENDQLYADYKKSKAELQRRNSIEYASEMELECAKVKELKRRDSIEYASEMELKCAKVRGDLLSYKMEYERTIMDKSYQCSKRKKERVFSEKTTFLETRMDESISGKKNCQSSLEFVNIQRDINTIITGVELCKQKIAKPTYQCSKRKKERVFSEKTFCPVITKINVGLFRFLKSLNEEMVADLRYFNSLEFEVDSLTSQLETQKTQFVNEIDRLSREYYYADHMNAILGVYTELDEVTNLQCDYLELLQKCECLETELSKSKMMSKSFESVQKHAINLELELQQCKEKDLKAQLQDKGIVISELKKLIEKLKG
nr:hypothetical protein [Tanacetum cinerariifolium]